MVTQAELEQIQEQQAQEFHRDTVLDQVEPALSEGEGASNPMATVMSFLNAGIALGAAGTILGGLENAEFVGAAGPDNGVAQPALDELAIQNQPAPQPEQAQQIQMDTNMTPGGLRL